MTEKLDRKEKCRAKVRVVRFHALNKGAYSIIRKEWFINTGITVEGTPPHHKTTRIFFRMTL